MAKVFITKKLGYQLVEKFNARVPEKPGDSVRLQGKVTLDRTSPKNGQPNGAICRTLILASNTKHLKMFCKENEIPFRPQ